MTRRVYLLLLLAAVMMLAAAWRAGLVYRLLHRRGVPVGVGVVCARLADNPNKELLAAYESVLQEEGVPYSVLSAPELLALRPARAARMMPVVVFPDNLAQALPEDTAAWVMQYVEEGGNALIVYDAGTRFFDSSYRPAGLFAELAGVDYLRYETLRENAYIKSSIAFTDEEAATFFQIPPGKTYQGSLLSGYAYGTLEYPVANGAARPGLSSGEIYATAVSTQGVRIPAIVLRRRARGSVLYVNLPLGSLKAYSDDLPLRAVVRTSCFRIAAMPHLLAVPGGTGGIVVNWHIDSSIEWKSLPRMVAGGYLRPELSYSLGVTAGDFRDRPGDGLGFDAAGRGAPYLAMISSFGVVGSHGGWAHNWFSENVEKGLFKEQEMEEYIRQNRDALAAATGYAGTEYAAPDGVHPQPAMTRVLERLGFDSYYYTGDSGSAPNRTFIDGVMVSSSVIGFPVIPFGKAASFFEMEQARRTEHEVTRWLLGVADYAALNRTVRLLYSHPYDIEHYPAALRTFLDYIQKKQAEGVLTVRPMSYYARFLLRFLDTDYRFLRDENTLRVKVKNTRGLGGLTVAVPSSWCKAPAFPDVRLDADETYYYVTFPDTLADTEKELVFELRS